MASLRSLSALFSRSSLSTFDRFAATASRASAARLMPPSKLPAAYRGSSLVVVVVVLSTAVAPWGGGADVPVVWIVEHVEVAVYVPW